MPRNLSWSNLSEVCHLEKSWQVAITIIEKNKGTDQETYDRLQVLNTVCSFALIVSMLNCISCLLLI